MNCSELEKASSAILQNFLQLHFIQNLIDTVLICRTRKFNQRVFIWLLGEQVSRSKFPKNLRTVFLLVHHHFLNVTYFAK